MRDESAAFSSFTLPNKGIGLKRLPTMNERKEVHLAGKALDRRRHVCAFFNSKDEEYRALLPFVKEGIDQGHKGFHIVKEGHRPEHRRLLAAAGIGVADAEANGQLEI